MADDEDVRAEPLEQESAGAMLTRMGVDAERWTLAFRETFYRLVVERERYGMSFKDAVEDVLAPEPGDWLFGWFANAIGAGESSQQRAPEAVPAGEAELLRGAAVIAATVHDALHPEAPWDGLPMERRQQLAGFFSRLIADGVIDVGPVVAAGA
jgi:hypothetical protein